MNAKIIRSSLAVVLLAGLVAARAGMDENKPAAKADGPCPCKLIKGVVHLRDNDVRFARKDGRIVFVDPTSGPGDPVTMKGKLVKPDLILITHAHGDHFQPAVLLEYQKQNPQLVLAGPADVARLAQEKGVTGMQTVVPNQTYTLAGFEFSTVPAYFAETNRKHPQENNWVGYVLPLNGARYYVTGDTGPTPEMETVKADVILPLLSGCGGNMAEALKMAKLSGAKLVIPVHTSGQTETIKKYVAQLPEGVKSAYFLDGALAPKS